MSLPAPRNSNFALNTKTPTKSVKRPLGTADWYQFPEGTSPSYQVGDFWLGRLPSTKQAIGLSDHRHVLVAAGSQSGKDISCVIPNILNWKGSIVVIDPKGENAIVAARRRSMGSEYTRGLSQQVYILDPFGVVDRPVVYYGRTIGVPEGDDNFSELKARFNPLDMLKPDDKRAPDLAGRIAASFADEDMPGGEPYFPAEAVSFIKVLMLHVRTWAFFDDNVRNLVTMRGLLLEGDAELQWKQAEQAAHEGKEAPSGFACLFDSMRRNLAYGGLISRAGKAFAHLERTSPKTMAGIIGTARTFTKFIDSISMHECLSASDFSLSELKSNPDGVSVFLSIPQNEMPDQFTWLRMMTTLIVGELQNSLVQPASKRPVLMVLNEFAGLRRMKVIENAVAQIAGFGAKMMFVVQGLPQLKEVYKDNWETFIACCSTKIFFGTEDVFTQEYVAKLVGDHEVIRSTKAVASTEGSSTSRAKGFTSTQTSGSTSGRSNTATYGGNGSSASWSSGASSSWAEAETTTMTHAASQGRTDTSTETVHRRPLLNLDEVRRYFGDPLNPLALVIASGQQPLVVRRCPYFEDPVFAGRFDPHSAHKPPLSLEQRFFREINDRAEAERFALLEAEKAEALRLETERRLELEAIERERKAERQRELNEIARVRAERQRKRERILMVIKWIAVIAAAIPPLMGIFQVCLWWYGLYEFWGFFWVGVIIFWFWMLCQEQR